VLKSLKEDHANHCIYSIALYGTESVKDLIVHESPTHPQSISPFSYEDSWKCGRFTENNVKELLSQFAKTVITKLDVAEIASDIFELTLSHRGLTGACCRFIERTYKVVIYVLRFGDHRANPEDADLRFLLAEGLVIEAAREPQQVLTGNGLVEIICATPILCSIILSEIRPPPINIAPEDMPDPDNVDPRWLLTHTIE
ncbi:10854_t:CDS:2, partial [Paraglomus brasilianum]